VDKRRERGGDHGNQYTGSKEAKSSNEPIAQEDTSAAETAKIVGISESTVKRTRTILDHGTPEVKAAEMQSSHIQQFPYD
jgi:hypothetical protein